MTLKKKKKKKVDKLKVRHKDQVENVDNFFTPWEELQFKHNRYGLGYNKVHDNLLFLIISNVLLCKWRFLNDNRNRYRGLLRMMMLLQVFQILMMLNWIMNPYNANTVTSLAMMSQSVLIFTHAVFVGRPITS
jgi:hypothetical protein